MGAPMSSTQESPYYFASPNLCQLHWVLDENGDKKPDSGWLASAAGEENRWLEALSIAEIKFPDPKYRLFANCLAWGLMGATDFDPGAVGHFKDPGTPLVQSQVPIHRCRLRSLHRRSTARLGKW
jgi:hypothetical protein